MSAPLVSIITRTRDRPVLLRRAVQSVLGQASPPPWEWIVVNDAGERGAVEAVLQPAREAHPERIRLLHLSESRGMEHASNQGIAASSGRFLVLHDDDDSWEPPFLHTMGAWLEDPAHADFAGVVCHTVRVVERIEDGAIQEAHRHLFNADLQAVTFWRVLKENPFPPISFLFRRSAYAAVGPFDPALPVLGDWEFNLRVLSRFPIGLLACPLAHYHHRLPGGRAEDSNTVTAQDQLHRRTEALLRSKWAESSAFGIPPEHIGAALRISNPLHLMEQVLLRMRHRAESFKSMEDPQF